ncbi:hypothetical protein [Sporomusa sp. KB1]|jgi:hypothetical protein|uniref:hypothetical protein n=1 Tax=Sporomusa sp. KB1 TaxID=943346 RepID=UPI0011A25C64|nr:hypothetical protein [Sporomusa sp. KB1]TWH45230.1 hypothetical protein Salpa_1135 [Sporomusa sp. KB1]
MVPSKKLLTIRLVIFVQFPPTIEEQNLVPGPGVMVGDTILHDSGLVVTPGENQTMTFKLDGVGYSISLSPGNHSPQQLLDDINLQLKNAGTDVTASYSGEHIALYSPTKVIDSFGGDMVEINNPYTSVKVYLFGSWARGEEHIKCSTLDFKGRFDERIVL